ncbi:outer membrane beta-barrel protein [Flavobacterium agricola]|uniref:Outer membrane beta-barrel protein n=1 Tax=Flavobacterium agricola TaxID=2870839 RepID=A0ABY6M0G0_9FLAO|nr:OmpW family outer membrane protein [Flavobacterium agricola]UYW02044.1 outer membrane beta-barrel protein [Flavobacterium agricola]
MKKVLLAVVALAGVFTTTYAQTSDTSNSDFKKWQIRVRGVGVVPNVSGANVGGIGGDIQISNQFIPELDISYFFTKNIAAELILGTTKHKVNTTGSDLTAVGGPASADVDLGSVWLLPPTLTVQYHFYPGKDNVVKPYVGAGINYTIFYDSKPGAVQKVKYDNKAALALQVGSDFNITDNFFLNIDAKFLFLKTNAKVDASNLVGGAPLDIPASVRINPLLLGFGVGYRF